MHIFWNKIKPILKLSELFYMWGSSPTESTQISAFNTGFIVGSAMFASSSVVILNFLSIVIHFHVLDLYFSYCPFFNTFTRIILIRFADSSKFSAASHRTHELHGFLYHIVSEEIILDIETVTCLNLILHDGGSACSLCFILSIGIMYL